MLEIVLYQENNLRHAAVLQDREVCEYHRYTAEKAVSLAGTIWKGRIERIVPGMEAAFVQLGLVKNGFLPLKEAPGFQGQRAGRPPLQTGQEIMVQIKKDPSGEKGAYLTRDITFPGTYAILLPLDTFCGVSQRVGQAQERDSLLALARELAPSGMGLVMRSAALLASREAVEEEIASLKAAWEAVEAQYPKKNAPQLLYEGLDPFSELLRDYPARNIARIITNIEGLAVPGIEVSVTSGSNLLTVFAISSQVERALQRKVWLKSGGYLVFDLCEAMTVIDVNTGKFTGKKMLADTIFTLNRDACREIARQMRLRNLGGIILIDFIDMEQEQHRQAVLEALGAALYQDRIKTVVHGFTSLGLVECTRKKARLPLHLALAAPCPRCGGSGYVPKKDEPEGEVPQHG